MIHKTWNVSQRRMSGLNRKTHKYIIEPINETRHTAFHLQKRFINFSSKIMKSDKTAVRNLFHIVKNDCQSVTGRNLRFLMTFYDKGSIDELHKENIIPRPYAGLKDEDEWRVDFIKELVNVRNGQIELNGFDKDDITLMLDFVAIS